MTREVYTDTEFIEFSHSQVFLRLFVDTDAQGDRLARKFGVRGYPTWIVLDKTGREIDRLVGARSARGLKAAIESIFDAAGPDEEVAKQPPIQPLSQTPQSPPAATAGAPPAAAPNPAPATKAATQADKAPPDPAIGVEPKKSAGAERIARLEKSLAAAKDEAEKKWLWLMLGLAHFQEQHWKEAKMYVSQVLEKDPNNAAALDLMKALDNK
jgi:tetratricopeptide (TPR) repeat protein